MLDLRRLHYFLAVASTRNFTRAAEQLHVAQPALSRQVRLLEEELGVELVRRTTHSFELTDAGALLVERGTALVEAAESLRRTMRGFGSGEYGRVEIAYGTSAGYDTAPRLLRAIGDRLPEVEVVSRVLSTEDIVAGLEDRSLDVGVVRCPPVVDGLESRLLRQEPQGVLVRNDHAFAAAPTVGLADLRGETLLIHPREANPGHYEAVLELLRDAGVEPRLKLRDLTFDIAQMPVVDGQAVAIVGESTRAGLPGELSWLPLHPSAFLEVGLLARAFDRAPVVDRVLDAAEEVADELGWRQPV